MKMTDREWWLVRRESSALINWFAHNPTLRSATLIISKGLTVALTRRHRCNGRAKREEFVLTYGAPNYAAREHIRRHGPKGMIERRWPAKKKGAK